MIVDFRLHLDAALRIGSGLPSLVADDTVVRGPDGPLIPSTTIKGAVRAAAAAVSDPPIDDAVLLRTFGRRDGDPGIALFSDALPAEGQQPIVEEITRVSLSPARTARRGRLMTHEVIAPLARTAHGLQPATFVGHVRILDDDRAAARTVVIGLASLTSLGAERSRGRGRVRVALDPQAAAWTTEAHT